MPLPRETFEAVRRYWTERVDDWKVATNPSGTLQFFEEVEAYRFEKLHYLPRLVAFHGYAGRRVLDVGCGLGNDLARFAQGGARVTGIDVSERAIELARQNFSLRGLHGDLCVMNGEAMSFPSDSFDLVYCHTVLQFTPDPMSMVQEIRRVLKPGGEAVLMAVNSRSWLFFLQRVMNVEIDHLDAPVYRKHSMAEFERLLTPFSDVQLVAERFPVATKVHKGLKSKLFNAGFVGTFNALPRGCVAPFGHHLIAFAVK